MKARVIETGEIEEFQANELNDYFTKDGVHYKGLELDFEDEPDYWTKLHHQAAIAAMQGILSNYELYKQVIQQSQVTTIAKGYATALVEKLKNEK